MPKRTDIKSILIIGSGPIVIGQACEFDYSGTQAVRTLKSEGYRIILVNSNPATIMTDPELADATYIEPINPEYIAEIIRKERPDAILPTMGGQTALNTAIELHELGILDQYNCLLIGANIEAIKCAEDRELFRRAMDEIGLESAKSELVHTIKDAQLAAEKIGYPMILRPSRTLGGTGGGIVHNQTELLPKVSKALSASPNHEVLIEESLIGWKEIELEVMRDTQDNVVIVCPIENLDPMGVHTGDSITVAPLMTVTDKEYQRIRDAAIKVIRRVGVDTGGSNVQFALNPNNGRLIVIEMNPRVSRSSALASKATGFPIAKIAAKLAVGYTLDEIPNDITKLTPACFEPSIDYVVVKIPRFNFEKFSVNDNSLGTQMRSVGEVMSFGRCFSEALQKAISSMENGTYGFDLISKVKGLGPTELIESSKTPRPERLWYLAEAFRQGVRIEELYAASGVDPWFLAEIRAIVQTEEDYLRKCPLEKLTSEFLKSLKREGFSDRRIASLAGISEKQVREKRKEYNILPTFKSVDTCAAEFPASTPYLYSTYDGKSDVKVNDRKKVIILGSGPNRIGQGIEFDYCCVHGVMALKEIGYETIMINCNPETVSTDYDTADRLYFEPLTVERVLSVIEREKTQGTLLGVVVQFGGQTPLKIARELEENGVPIIGTSVNSIEESEDRELFTKLVDKLRLRQAPYATAKSPEEALAASSKIGYPLMIRPSFVLGGRAMRIIYSDAELMNYFSEGVEVSEERPVLLDRYLYNAYELDVDAVADGHEVIIAGVMEHIEPAGVHSGDSACSLPPQHLGPAIINRLKEQTKLLARNLNVIGLINVQFAVTRDQNIYVLEVNPRASRTIPFVSKATGIPWAKIAAKVMAGKKLKELGVSEIEHLPFISVKAPVFPFKKFVGVDTLLGPEMKSTGEVMGVSTNFADAFLRAQRGALVKVPKKGIVFISVTDKDKPMIVDAAKRLIENNFSIVATEGTMRYLSEQGIEVERVQKVREGSPHIIDLIGTGKISLVINTPEGSGPYLDSRTIRLVANELDIPTVTTIAGANAFVEAIIENRGDQTKKVLSIQEYHKKLHVLQNAFYSSALPT